MKTNPPAEMETLYVIMVANKKTPKLLRELSGEQLTQDEVERALAQFEYSNPDFVFEKREFKPKKKEKV